MGGSFQHPNFSLPLISSSACIIALLILSFRTQDLPQEQKKSGFNMMISLFQLSLCLYYLHNRASREMTPEREPSAGVSDKSYKKKKAFNEMRVWGKYGTVRKERQPTTQTTTSSTAAHKRKVRGKVGIANFYEQNIMAWAMSFTNAWRSSIHIPINRIIIIIIIATWT